MFRFKTCPWLGLTCCYRILNYIKKKKKEEKDKKTNLIFDCHN